MRIFGIEYLYSQCSNHFLFIFFILHYFLYVVHFLEHIIFLSYPLYLTGFPFLTTRKFQRFSIFLLFTSVESTFLFRTARHLILGTLLMSSTLICSSNRRNKIFLVILSFVIAILS